MDVFEQIVRDSGTNVFVFGPVWGVERNYANGFHLGLSIGVGYVNGKYQNSGDINPIGSFELGYVLFSK